MALQISSQSLSWALLFGFVPSIAFLTYSYRQAIASNQNRLATVVQEAALKVDRLFETADSVLTRLAADIDDPSNPEALSILRRIVYNDPRFREAGIINGQGQLVSTSLGLVEPPIQISPQNRSDPTIQSLQVIGPGRTEFMREQSLILSLPTDGQGEVNLLVDPNVILYYLDIVHDHQLGPGGYLALLRSDGTVVKTSGLPSPQEDLLGHAKAGEIRAQYLTQDEHFIVVGSISREWVLSQWRSNVVLIIPIAMLSSLLLMTIFVRLIQKHEGLDSELKIALDNQEFEIHYQPIVNLHDGTCVGCEALMRWRHPEQGTIRPDLFIPLAERTGFIMPIGEWACSQVVSDFEKVFSKFPDFYVSINLSPVQINFDRMKTTVNTIIEAPGELQNSIVFEVVEGTLIDEEKTISPDTIARLRRMGFNVALDDFGTGYSSIRYLQKFEFDYLKIDRLFVGSIGREDRTGILVDTIIGIGQKLNLTLVAEGIETEEQRQALLQRGVCFGQGWLYSRALPLDEFEQYIQVSNPS
ncbi:MAG: EAL domain-containing protein [Cyanobacteria bacterium J06642_12]